MHFTMQAFLLTVTALATVRVSAADKTANEGYSEGRVWLSDGNLALTGTETNNIYFSLLFLIPILVAIVVLEFAIFGVFAPRVERLNPISRFFYHAREGLAIIKERNWNRRRRGRPGPFRPEPSRVARWHKLAISSVNLSFKDRRP